jgi:hypothetical protein
MKLKLVLREYVMKARKPTDTLRITDKIQTPSNSECHTPSSAPFKFHQYRSAYIHITYYINMLSKV